MCRHSRICIDQHQISLKVPASTPEITALFDDEESFSQSKSTETPWVRRSLTYFEIFVAYPKPTSKPSLDRRAIKVNRKFVPFGALRVSQSVLTSETASNR